MYKSPTRRIDRARLWLAAALVVASGAAWAQQEPLPIRIESDSAELSQQAGTSTYTGSVVLTRGGLTLTGNKLDVTRINDRGNVKAVLTGGPARLDKQPDRTGDDVVTGHSSRIEYTNGDSTVVMRGNAVVNRGGDRITSQVIRHNLDTQRTQAERGENDDERVQITITPQNDGDGS